MAHLALSSKWSAIVVASRPAGMGTLGVQIKKMGRAGILESESKSSTHDKDLLNYMYSNSKCSLYSKMDT